MTTILLGTAFSDATLRASAIRATLPTGLRSAIHDFVLARLPSDDRGARNVDPLGNAQVVPLEVAVTVLPDERPYAL